MKVTAWFKNAFVRLKSDRRKAGKEEHITLLIGSRRCGAFKRKFNFIWHWLLSFRPISDGCCCRSGLVQGPLVGPCFGLGNYFVDLPQSRFACNISSSFPAKNELLASKQATCSHVAPFASRLQCETKEERVKKEEKERGENIGVFGTPLCIILQLLSINARIGLVKINWEIITLQLESLFKSFRPLPIVRLSICPLHFNYRLAFAILANSSSSSCRDRADLA